MTEETKAPVTGEMLSRNPSNVAQTLMADYATGAFSKALYTEPHVVWHSYEGFDKLRRLDKPPAPGPRPPSRYADVQPERLQVIDGDGAVTVLLTSRVKTLRGHVFRNQAAMVHLLNDEGKIYRVEAYYDAQEQQRDSWLREHVSMYDGVPEGQSPTG